MENTLVLNQGQMEQLRSKLRDLAGLLENALNAQAFLVDVVIEESTLSDHGKRGFFDFMSAQEDRLEQADKVLEEILYTYGVFVKPEAHE